MADDTIGIERVQSLGEPQLFDNSKDIEHMDYKD
jgi:hypothetical protein